MRMWDHGCMESLKRLMSGLHSEAIYHLSDKNGHTNDTKHEVHTHPPLTTKHYLREQIKKGTGQNRRHLSGQCQ